MPISVVHIIVHSTYNMCVAVIFALFLSIYMCTTWFMFTVSLIVSELVLFDWLCSLLL